MSDILDKFPEYSPLLEWDQTAGVHKPILEILRYGEKWS